MQLETNNLDIVFEWIPYSQFNEINETGKNGLMTVYSAIWKNGPLYYQLGRYIRDPNKEIALKCLHNSQDQVESLLNEVKKHLATKHEILIIYGISQNPNTNDYILVQNNIIDWIIFEIPWGLESI
uniref:Protein kinase domain-containing protein n=1 Tax=Rhizophagus irregularis (strain DAOM 181602 / DAOM 197198 / MUCL 43194) TaxID=747089 RepID=U9UDZ3_RHIID